MNIYRPFQTSFTQQVLEQNRKFYFTASLGVGVNLQTGEALLDIHYLKDMFESMGQMPLPDTGMPKPNGEFLASGSFFAEDAVPVTGGGSKDPTGYHRQKTGCLWSSKMGLWTAVSTRTCDRDAY